MKVYVPDLANNAMTTDPYVPNPDVSESFQRTLAYLVALDKVAGTFRPLLTDGNGNLKLTTIKPEISNSLTRQVSVSTAAVTLATRNDKRSSITIRNGGKQVVRIFYKDDITGSVFWTLYPGEILYETEYAGQITATAPTINLAVFILELNGS